MTSSKHLVFTGSYAAAGQPGVSAFVFDSGAGTLTPCGDFDGILAPSFLAIHPTQPWLYAVSETSRGTDGTAGHVHALTFERSGERVIFTPRNVQPSGGDWPCHLRLDPSTNWLIVSNYGSGSAAVLPIQPDGLLGKACMHIQHHGHGADPERQEKAHVHSAIFTPDGEYAILADLGIDALVLYRFDQGRLEKISENLTRPGAGPRHMLFHPNGRVLYVTNELNGTLCVYDYANGRLDERDRLATLPGGFPQNLVADLHLSPAGDRLYVSNRGHNSLAVFAVTPEGQLTRLSVTDCGGNWPRNFAVAPDGHFILVANQYSGEIVSLSIRPETGEIGEEMARYPVPKAACVLFGPEI
ncbi:6-phosphogluconolactonase [Longilinea arvoryzae]|uniref:6-phosphogluconolactonase n=1 Tax=Longilinea arvoryzae TaxID=360412 RepID=A0A0S7BLN7_9CHLR|nr:lactonase family protein [Longilinea arvoryzae]GAP14677.1 6-phosphogluconolactonase [Longilinea arvoryzae]